MQGRTCTAVELAASAGCPAGEWPDPQKQGACVPPGAGPTLSSGVYPQNTGDLGLPAVAGLPALKPPRWCWKGSDKGCFEQLSNCKRSIEPCEVAEAATLIGCPAGQWPSPAADGACELAGVSWTCPPGFVALAGSADPDTGLVDCVPDPDECGSEKWPAVEGVSIVYVDAAASATGTGSQAAPFATLAQAVKVTPSGGMVAVAAGTYAESVGIPRPMRIRGRCAHLVTLASSKDFTVTTLDKGKGWLAELEGVTLTGTGMALSIGEGWRFLGRRLHVHKMAGGGVHVTGPGAELTLEDSVIADVTEVQSPQIGTGVQAIHQARVLLRRTRVHRSRSWGVLVVGAKTRLLAEGLRVDQTRPGPKVNGPGMGMMISQGARVDLHGAVLTDNRIAGVLITGQGSVLRASGLLVERNREQLAPTPAVVGMQLQGGGKAQLFGARLEQNSGAGLLIVDSNSQADAGGLVVADTVPIVGDNLTGRGIGIEGSATLRLVGAHVVGNRGMGITVTKAGGLLNAIDLLVEGTLPWADGKDGWGIGVLLGGRVLLRRSRISGSRKFGIRADNKQTWVGLRDVLIDNTSSSKEIQQMIAGIGAAFGAEVRFAGLRLSQNAFYGIRAESGALVRGGGLLVDHGAAANLMFDGGKSRVLFGMSTGILALTGSQIEVAGARVTRAIVFGAAASKKGARLSLRGALVDSTLAEPYGGSGGMGLDVSHGAELVALDSSLVGNHAISAVVQSAALTMERSVIRNTLVAEYDPRSGKVTDPPIEMADGILALYDATLVLDHVLVHDNQRSGVLADGSVDGKLANSAIIGNGFGLVTQNGAVVGLQGSLLKDNALGNVMLEGGLEVVAPPQVNQ